MKTSVLPLGLAALICCHLPAIAQTPSPFPVGKVSVVVRGEDGQPMPGTEVGVSFTINTYNNPIIQSTKGLSDNNGRVSAEGRCDRSVDFSAHKAGFYPYISSYRFKARAGEQWQPWDVPLEATLKRVIQPVPLYARKLDVELPGDAFPIGYDLVAADWVEPYGKGRSADFVFRADRQISSRTDYDVTLQLSFSNPGDGILPVELPRGGRKDGSVLLLPQMAPESGYLPLYLWHVGARNKIKELKSGKIVKMSDLQTESAPENQGYIFRVRTKVDPQGRIVQAMYGKIQREVSVFPGVQITAHAAVGFTYYLNPSGQPNLEFDPTRNLFGTLSINQEVREP